jgi:hypothetical protein
VGGIGVDVEIILKGIFKNYNGKVWNGFIWHTTRSSGWFLYILMNLSFLYSRVPGLRN